MPEELNESVVAVEPVVKGQPAERWDVGLGERLVETIWKWLGRDAVTLKDTPRHGEPVSFRKAA